MAVSRSADPTAHLTDPRRGAEGGGVMLAVDKHARLALRRELADVMPCARDLELYSDQLAPPDQHFYATRRRVSVAMHLLDDVGWSWQDSRDMYYLTAPPADLRWWINQTLQGVEESLRACARCFALAGHVYPREVLRASDHSADEMAADALEGAREASDRELELRSVLLALLHQLDQKSQPGSQEAAR